jgi:hypothetical protein
VKGTITVLISVLAVGFGTAGCGGDSSGETTAPTVSIPAVTTPTSSGPSPSGGVSPTDTQRPKTAPSGTTFDPGQPDSPTNDVPPPPGSPQEQFEQQCEQNPEACG